MTNLAEFQPTRPLRGATPEHQHEDHGDGISTHAPLAGRDRVRFRLMINKLLFQPTRPLRGATADGMRFKPCEEISTHAPLAGRDP